MFDLKSVIYNIFLIVFLLTGFLGISQSSGNNAMKKTVTENAKLFSSNLDKAYLQINPLLKKARVVKDSVSELKLLDRKCKYFYSKNQIDSLIKASEKLQNTANEYGDLYSETMGNIYMAEAYSINQFYDKALHHLDLAYKILEKDKSKNPKIFFAKANVLNSYANVYSDKGEPRKAVKKLYEIIDSYNDLDDPKEIKQFQYLNYSNIASLYVLYDIDSAYYFAEKSFSIAPSTSAPDKVMISNYQIFGKVYRQKKDYKKSLYYYYKALDLSKKTGEQLNINNLYKDIADVYKITGKKDSAIIYENKLKQHEISELQSKYNSLHEVIDKDQKEEKQSKTVDNIVLVIVLVICLFILIWSTLSIKKRKGNKEEPHEAYNKLLNLIKANDPAFMFSFEKTHPNFSDKLLKINPQLSNSEIEFCAFLKLKLSTKEIAKITFIEPRTVQNKKYRIRKRLNIPTSMDIYNWFDSI